MTESCTTAVRFQLNEEDCALHHRFVLRNTDVGKKVVSGYLWTLFIMLGLFVACILACASALDALFGGWVWVVVISLFVIPFARRRVIKRIVDSERRRARKVLGDSAFDPATVTIDPGGIVYRTDKVESRMQWQALERIEQTDTHIFLMLAAYRATVIPKRSFDSPDAAVRFYERAKEFCQAARGV